MYNFKSYLQDLSESAGICFELIGEDGIPIYQRNLKIDDSEKLEFAIMIGKQKATVIIEKKYEICTSILKYSIENKYRELFSLREQSLVDILEGKEVSIDKIDRSFSFLSKGCTLFIISIDGSRYEALDIVKQLYNEQDVISMFYSEYIIVIGDFDEIEEHAKSIKESIVSDLYCKCYVSYGEMIYSADNIKKAYYDAKECMTLGKTFEIKGEIYNCKKMLLEKVVWSIAEDVKIELMNNFKEKFGSFDSEIINTIEEFLNNGLNISEASRKLYIHRNTLIYRLDKIYKDTGYDIRDFKQAAVFIIAFLVWKENR